VEVQMAGNTLGLPKAFLGATLLAWGASAGDLAALMATARAGRGHMAISACFAGPLFQLLVGKRETPSHEPPPSPRGRG
jgi:sodium/potassium/calcium exchanger 6